MSTRSVIARPLDGGFEGRYCHWDGYPTARGAQVWQTVKDLDGDVARAIEYALRPGTEGYWSSYTAPSDPHEPPHVEQCIHCHGAGTRNDEYVKGTCNGCGGKGSNVTIEQGFRTDNGDSWVTSHEDDMGAEWAYVLNVKSLSVFMRHYGDCGQAVGMFGMAAANDDRAHWHLVSTHAWDAPEPDWSEVEEAAVRASEPSAVRSI